MQVSPTLQIAHAFIVVIEVSQPVANIATP
jgi:hypothetical protein